MDVGKYAHSIRNAGYLEAVNHINIQIVTKVENIKLDVHLRWKIFQLFILNRYMRLSKLQVIAVLRNSRRQYVYKKH